MKTERKEGTPNDDSSTTVLINGVAHLPQNVRKWSGTEVQSLHSVRGRGKGLIRNKAQNYALG